MGADGQRLLRADVITPPTVSPSVAQVVATRNAGYSHYNALQVQFQRRGGGVQGGQSALYAVGGPRSGQLTVKLQL